LICTGILILILTWSNGQLLQGGFEAGLGAVGTGSHVDAIPFSGKYDGVVGVLGALEAISLLKR